VFAPFGPPPAGAEFAAAFVFSRETGAGGLFEQAVRRSVQAARAETGKSFCIWDDSWEEFRRTMIARRPAGVTWEPANLRAL
jgi:hypothetical protein